MQAGRALSRAFVSEDAEAAKAAMTPDRPVSSAPNWVTPEGMRAIEARVESLQGALAAAGPEAAERPGLQRDLRYWRARSASARLVRPVVGPAEVAFGATVTIRQGERTTRWRIVGEDEADPAHGTLAWTAPLARALLGAAVGDVVEPGAGRPSVTVDRIE